MLAELRLHLIPPAGHPAAPHQTLHLSTGCMALPSGHLKSWANSGELEKGPRTRNIPGLWAPVLIRFSSDLGRYLEHHVFAALEGVC